MASLTREDIRSVIEIIKELYLEDMLPWICGYSGGKDSTAIVQLVWYALQELPTEKLKKTVHVISTDTLVESPVVAIWATESLKKMDQTAKQQGLPIVSHRLTPTTTNTFWVNLIGRGYPYPRRDFRWCTGRLKIDASNRFIQSILDAESEAILVLGSRKAESATRRAVLEEYEKKRYRAHLSPNGSFSNSYVFTPIENWSNDNVWQYLVQFPNPWGHSNKDLLAMYSGASSDGECPLVIDTSTPSCGNSRFGCWVCTMVTEDKRVQVISATGMMLYERLIAEVFQNITEHIEALINQVDAQENKRMSLDAHLEAADEKTLAMQLFDVMKSIDAEKALANADLQRQHDSIEALKRQRNALDAKKTQLLKAVAERAHINDDNARIVKYAAMSIEVLREFKRRLQSEKVAKLSSTVTSCFQELVEKDSLVSRVCIDPSTLDVTILDTDGCELLKSQLSAGEQQMFAISIVWALALTSGYKAPVVIDTPMARLDSSHRANFVTKYLPAASSQVIVLSTDEEVYGRYLDLIRDNVVDYYTLLYREEDQCTSIIHGYFGEV